MWANIRKYKTKSIPLNILQLLHIRIIMYNSAAFLLPIECLNIYFIVFLGISMILLLFYLFLIFLMNQILRQVYRTLLCNLKKRYSYSTYTDFVHVSLCISPLMVNIYSPLSCILNIIIFNIGRFYISSKTNSIHIILTFRK